VELPGPYYVERVVISASRADCPARLQLAETVPGATAGGRAVATPPDLRCTQGRCPPCPPEPRATREEESAILYFNGYPHLRHNVHPAQVTSWKTDLVKGAPDLFERKNAPDHERNAMEKGLERLERKVGQLVIEKEFLEKKCVQLGIDP
jgi:hypothetical protein